MSENPYATPQAPVGNMPPETEQEVIRRRYLTHETAIKSVGFLFCFVGFIAGLAGLMALVKHVHLMTSAERIVVVMILGLGLLYFVVGIGLRYLMSWAKALVAIIFGIVIVPFSFRIAHDFILSRAFVLRFVDLIVFVIATIINGYVLYLVSCKKGKFVFSDEYQIVILDTSDLKYKTPVVLWIFVLLLLFLLAFKIVSAVFGS